MTQVISYLEERIESLKQSLTFSYEPESYYKDVQARLYEVEDILYHVRRM